MITEAEFIIQTQQIIHMYEIVHIIIYGDDDLIVYQMNLCQSLQILKRDNDHVQTDIMYQVHENGKN